jgi:hypothetical protein
MQPKILSSARKPLSKFPHLCALSHNVACKLVAVQQFVLYRTQVGYGFGLFMWN